nr:MAG TPA: DNA gyrase inhibitor [Caudoviricetes sp.]DAO06760.1 MAG TPA: DNA gyrase inhibitor [Caudoviricetes sp.]DAO57162.1 MAG TPA: DNA gyrase inhibitor [Caudoviricetes sp.]DAW76930.1 MAG TPA: DNA gyrase inhibitor [Caudoviricetes sp.]
MAIINSATFMVIINSSYVLIRASFPQCSERCWRLAA